MGESCADCRFSRPANPTTVECRRHAPRFVPPGQTLQVPRMSPDFWCGEHEPVDHGKVDAPRARRKAEH